MPPLPADRVQRRTPFQSVGVDYLGPTTARGVNGIGKVWILLFTCLSTPAIYIEPTFDLTGQQFLEVFRRLASHRGRPQRVLSDNGTQFQLAAKTVMDATTNLLPPVQWRFIPQISPWQGGGVYERLVALIKAAFKASLGRTILTREQLRTFTAEEEAGINSIPLTYVSTEVDGLLPLRPIDFIQPGLDKPFNLVLWTPQMIRKPQRQFS